MLDLELGRLGACELESSDALTHVSDGHRDLVVLVRLDIYGKKGKVKFESREILNLSVTGYGLVPKI